jgi:ankyrin repeat protein
VIIAKKRQHVADATANIGNVTSSKSKSQSKVQRPATDVEVNTTLIRYARNGDEEALCLLLANGDKVDVTDESGSTLLSIAARCGKEGAVCMLLKAGAAVKPPDKYGMTALMCMGSSYRQ